MSHQERINESHKKNCKFCMGEIKGNPFYLPRFNKYTLTIEKVPCCADCYYKGKSPTK